MYNLKKFIFLLGVISGMGRLPGGGECNKSLPGPPRSIIRDKANLFVPLRLIVTMDMAIKSPIGKLMHEKGLNTF